MPSFNIIQNVNEINLNSEWVDSQKFDSQGRIVDEKGDIPSVNYEGHSYTLIAKLERQFSFLEHVARIFLGILLSVATLCTALCYKSVRKLFDANEKIRFGIPFQNGILPKNDQNPEVPVDHGVNFLQLPGEIKEHIFNFINIEDFSKTSSTCKDLHHISNKFLDTEEFKPIRIAKLFKTFQKQLKVENYPLPPFFEGFMANENTFSFGPCPKAGGLIIIQKGDSEYAPLTWLKGEFQVNNNHCKWKLHENIRDKEISEGDKNYSFFTDDDGYYDSKLTVIDPLSGDCLYEIDPFEGLTEEELRPPYQANDPRFLSNFPKYNGDLNLSNLNQGWGKGIVGAHSFNGGNKILILTRSGLVRQWDIDRKQGVVSSTEEPLKIFEAYAGECYTNVEKSWLSGNSLFVEVYTNDEWSFSTGKESGKKALHQYDIRNNELISRVDLTHYNHIAVNSNTLFVASLGATINLPCELKAYRIDSDTLNLTEAWSFATANAGRKLYSQTLAVNNMWVVLVIEGARKITILDANSGEVFWEIPTIEDRYIGEHELGVHLFDDLVVFRDKKHEESKRCCIAHIPLKEMTHATMPTLEKKQVRRVYKLGDNDADIPKFKLDLKNMKLYGLITKEDEQSLIEISKG